MGSKPKKGSRSGHPGRQDPVVALTDKTMRAAISILRDAGSRLSAERYSDLRSACLGLMYVHSELAGLPAPDTNLDMDYDEFMAQRQKEREHYGACSSR